MSVPTLRASLDRDELTLAAGESAAVTVTVRVVGRTVQHVAVRVEGLPDGATYDPGRAPVKLRPGESAEVVLTLRLPDPPPLAGPRVLGVLCSSTHDPSVSCCEELRLTVAPAPALTLSFAPESVRTRRHGRFVGTLANTGNVALTPVLHVRDPEERVRLDLTPPAPAVPPGAAARVVLTATAPVLWTGQEHRHTLAVRATADGAEAARDVTLVQAPRLPAGVLRLAGGAAGVLALAGAVVGGLALARGPDPAPAAATTAPATTAPGTTPPTTPDATPTPTPPSPTPEPTTETPTPTPTPTPSATVPADRAETFDALTPGPADGAFDGFRVSVRGEGTCASTSGLLAQESDGDVALAPAATAAECQDAPLVVLFAAPARDVVLQVPDDDASYEVRVEDEQGTTRTHTLQATDGEVAVPGTRAGGLRSVQLQRPAPETGPGPVLLLSGVAWRDAPP